MERKKDRGGEWRGERHVKYFRSFVRSFSGVVGFLLDGQGMQLFQILAKAYLSCHSYITRNQSYIGH